jgi:hypothetical protein
MKKYYLCIYVDNEGNENKIAHTDYNFIQGALSIIYDRGYDVVVECTCVYLTDAEYMAL